MLKKTEIKDKPFNKTLLNQLTVNTDQDKIKIFISDFGVNTD